MYHVFSFLKDTIHLDVHALGQRLYYPKECTNFLQESFSPHLPLIRESLKILRVTEGSNFLNFFNTEAHHHLLNVSDSILSFFLFFFVVFFFHVALYLALRLELPLKVLFGAQGTITHHVPSFLVIEAFAFFGKLASFLGA